MATRQDPDISENYLHDEYTDDELNQKQLDRQGAGIEGPFAAGVNLGGTLAGNRVVGGSNFDAGDRSSGGLRRETVTGWDSNGDPVEQDPALEGTVAGNTNAAQALVGGSYTERKPRLPEEDLGPEGTIVQELGGEARF
jgi:hypothetical protein